MQRLTWFALLAISVLLAGAPLQAQRSGGGGGFRGGGSMGSGPHFGGLGNGPRFGRNRYANYGSVYLPWYGDYGFDDGYPADYSPQPPSPAPSPVVIVMQGQERPAPPREAPKLTEVPQLQERPASKPLPPTLFVFTNGKKLETSRYLLTAASLELEIGRQQRSVPISALDVDATLAANRERGIDLKIPSNRNSVSIGF
jgi:hypothetical protein